MRHCHISEKAKDRLLDIALVCSLVLLVGVVASRPGPGRKEDTPQNSYALERAVPLRMTQLPTFEEAQAVPDAAPATGQRQTTPPTPVSTVPHSQPSSSAAPRSRNLPPLPLQPAAPQPGSLLDRLIRPLGLITTKS